MIENPLILVPIACLSLFITMLFVRLIYDSIKRVSMHEVTSSLDEFNERYAVSYTSNGELLSWCGKPC
jgi:hypothetical protein